jgi:hypothetical protein
MGGTFAGRPSRRFAIADGTTAPTKAVLFAGFLYAGRDGSTCKAP